MNDQNQTAPSLTKEDINSLDWNEFDQRNCEKSNYYLQLNRFFNEASTICSNKNQIAQAEGFRLLAHICILSLNKPENVEQPFGCFIQIGDQRSTILEDFNEIAINFFSEILEHIDDIWLKARIADVLWLIKRPRDRKHADIAIKYYSNIPLIDYWFKQGKKCCIRAIVLSKQLRQQDKLNEILSSLYEAFTQEITKIQGLDAQLAQVLFDHNLLHDKPGEALAIAEVLEQKAAHYVASNNFHQAQVRYELAIKWFERLKEGDRKITIIENLAECHVADAEYRINNNEAGRYLNAQGLYHEAIQLYLTIKKEERNDKTNERINQLKQRKQEINKLTIHDMKTITIEIPPEKTNQINQQQENTKKTVNTLSLHDALNYLVNFFPLPSKANFLEILESVEHFIVNDMPQSVLSGDGRMASKFDPSSSGSNETAISFLPMCRWKININFITHTHILPAVEVIFKEHALEERELFDWVSESALVPQDHRQLVAKGLHKGFERDFVSALYILTPQLEHIVRCELKKKNVVTTTDKNGIEDEIGLSGLMDKTNINNIFGEDLAFNLKMLFCEKGGPNLRNEIAHGLLNDAGSQSEFAVYAWWIIFQMIYNHPQQE